MSWNFKKKHFGVFLDSAEIGLIAIIHELQHRVSLLFFKDKFFVLVFQSTKKYLIDLNKVLGYCFYGEKNIEFDL